MIQNALNFKKELENSSFTLKVIFDMVFTIVILSVALNWLVGLILYNSDYLAHLLHMFSG